MIKNNSKSSRLIVKRGEVMEKLKEKFEKYLGDDLDFEEFSKKKISQKEYDEISKILDLLVEYKDVFPNELQYAVDYLVANILVVEKAEKVEKVMKIKTFEELEKSIKGLSEVPADNEVIQKNIDFLKELLKSEDKDNNDDGDNKDNKDNKDDGDDKINKDTGDNKDAEDDKEDDDKIVKVMEDIVKLLKKSEIRVAAIEKQSKGRVSTDANDNEPASNYPTLEKNWG